MCLRIMLLLHEKEQLAPGSGSLWLVSGILQLCCLLGRHPPGHGTAGGSREQFSCWQTPAVPLSTGQPRAPLWGAGHSQTRHKSLRDSCKRRPWKNWC